MFDEIHDEEEFIGTKLLVLIKGNSVEVKTYEEH